MKSTVTVLLLSVFLLRESFACYLTGIRSTLTRQHPEASVNPVVFAPRDQSKEHSHWKGRIDVSAVVEIGKDDETGNSRIEDKETDNADKGEIHQETKILVEMKVGGPPTGNGHWMPVQDVPSIEKNVHDIHSAKEKEVPYDVPSIEDKNITDNVPGIPAKPNDKSITEEYRPNSPNESPSKAVSVDVEENLHPNISNTEHPDITKMPIVDEKIPSFDSENKPSRTHKPLEKDSSIHDVTGGGPLSNGPGVVGPDVGVQSGIESDGKTDVAIAPQPFTDISPKDESTGAKTELLEPDPITVGSVNKSVNLHELMGNLESSRFRPAVEETFLKDALTGESKFNAIRNWMLNKRKNQG